MWLFSLISGKSLLIKERTFRAKKHGRDVVFMSMGSCDVFGIPSKFSLVYDLITKREMNSLGIQFMNAKDLLKLCGKKAGIGKRDDNRQLVMDTVEEGLYGKITYSEFSRILRQHGIDIGNAIEFYHESKNSSINTLLETVYDLLIAYCKENNQQDINIDEFPILLNYTSMLVSIKV